MATAYKEMDLLDEAIREFQLAAALTLPADNTARYFQCCNMLGHCFIQKGMPRAAVIWFKKGLEAPGRSAEEYKALQYELGSGYEEMGDLIRAIGVFTEVYGVDVGYRDVAEKLQDLQARQRTQKNKKKVMHRNVNREPGTDGDREPGIVNRIENRILPHHASGLYSARLQFTVYGFR